MPSNLNAEQSTGGTLTAGTHFYKVTALTASGESLASNLASAVTADGGAVDLTWIGHRGRDRLPDLPRHERGDGRSALRRHRQHRR